MAKDISNYVSQCKACILRKVPTKQTAPLHPITSKEPLELLCIDFLTVEPCKGGIENILVLTILADFLKQYPVKILLLKEQQNFFLIFLLHILVFH